jgi:beta-hydroxyacyl-ACP dehydratase FabZ
VALSIPHAIDRFCYRFPSVLVDAVMEHEPGRRLVAVKNVSVSEDFFQGHFPGTPLMPGVLMIETLAQVAALLLVQSPDGRPSGSVYLRGVDNAKFRRQVVPGDRLRLEVTLGARRATLARAHAVASIDDAVVAEAELVMALVPEPAGARAGVTIDATAIVHPGATIGAGTVVGPHAIVGDRRVERHRRVDRNRRRQRGIPVRVDRADSAGPQV